MTDKKKTSQSNSLIHSFLNVFCFEIGSYHVIQPWLAWVSKRFACLSHLGAGTKGVHHHAQFHPIFEALVMQCCSGIVEENWDLSIDQCWLLVLQFSVQLIILLSTLLECILPGFKRLQIRAASVSVASYGTSLAFKVLWNFLSVQPPSWPWQVTYYLLSFYAKI